MIRADQLTEPVSEHGEGPVWWPDEHLRFVDLLAGDLVDLDGGGTIARTHVADIAATVRPRLGGGAVVAVARGIVLIDEHGTTTKLPDVWSDPDIRMNDGGCDPDGRFYCGSMAYDAAPGRGRLFCFSADGTAEVVIDNVTVSNGFAFAPDGSVGYYVDTPTRRIDVFDYDRKAGLGARRRFVEIDLGGGSPDGITVDGEGGVWVAMWGAESVRHYTQGGRLDEVVMVPGVPHVTACALGGPNLDRLFITTSRLGVDHEAAGPSGAVFVVDGVTPGTPVTPARL
jgi:sugar lactone lactonase YvrE